MNNKYTAHSSGDPSLTGIRPVKVNKNAETNSTKSSPSTSNDSSKKNSSSSKKK